SNKCLCGVMAASVAAKKARLKVEMAVSMSCGSTALIVIPPSSPAFFAAVVWVSSLLLIDLSMSSSFSAPPAAVVTLPPPPANTVMYDPVWSFREEPGESLVLGTVALRSSICSSSSAACLSPAQAAAELGLQGPAVPLSSPYEEASVWSLASTAT
ncbi:hypothetical protein BDFG_09053, partial [Blastomyces dermatitidis ATCC 26199]